MNPASARAELGLTWTQFGDLIGVSERQVANWESGARKPSASARRLINLFVLLHRRGELKTFLQEIDDMENTEDESH